MSIIQNLLKNRLLSIDKMIKTKGSPMEDSTTKLINHLEKYV